jgi:3-hydroxybutyrate dehydrogenase
VSSKRAAIVTGAAGGIGRAVAERLLADGLDVLSVDLEASDDLPGTPHGADLTTREGNRSAVDAALEHFGRLDVIVPNAGLQHVAPVKEFPEDRWDALVALMLTSPFLLARYGWEHLAASGDGRYIAIASAHALVASPFKAGYVAAKHGVLGLTKTAAIEYAEAHIRVNAVCPGYIKTPMTEETMRRRGEAILAQVPFHRMGNPEEIAEMVVWLCSDRASYVSGAAYNVDGGWMAI